MRRHSSGQFRLVRATDRFSVNCVRLVAGGIGYIIFDRLALADDETPTIYADWNTAYAIADENNRRHREEAA